MKHIHAENMRLYAEDAMETDKPWERWEYSIPAFFNRFQGCNQQPSWEPSTQYRRKPRTIQVNGFDVPEPVRKKLKDGDKYFVPSVSSKDFFGGTWIWFSDGCGQTMLSRGLIHLTKENAIIHAKAMLGIDPYAKEQE